MWQFHLVDNYDGGSALIVRIHHCYADGIALVRVMLSMTDASAQWPPGDAVRAAAAAQRGADDDDMLAQLLAPLSGVLGTARKVGATLVDKGVGALVRSGARPSRSPGRARALTAEIAKLALMPQDSPTRFKGKPGVAQARGVDRSAAARRREDDRQGARRVGERRAAVVRGGRVARLSRRTRATSVDGVMMRALVPVNLRPLEKAYKLGNQFGLVFLDLPIGIENPVERLYAVRANMNALKGSFQPVLALGLLAAMGSGPKALQDVLLQALARNASGVMTNVPGPQQPLYLAGAAIESLMFWVPQSGDIGMGVSIISYNGAVQFGVITDRGLCPDPDRISERFGAEFEKLVLAR